MSSVEKENRKTTTFGKEGPRGSTDLDTKSTLTAANSRPEPTTTTSNGSTDESVTAFVERTLTRNVRFVERLPRGSPKHYNRR